MVEYQFNNNQKENKNTILNDEIKYHLLRYNIIIPVITDCKELGH